MAIGQIKRRYFPMQQVWTLANKINSKDEELWTKVTERFVHAKFFLDLTSMEKSLQDMTIIDERQLF